MLFLLDEETLSHINGIKRCIREVLGFSSEWKIVKYSGIRDVSGKCLISLQNRK